MRNSIKRSTYEANLAVAHRALWRAQINADDLGDQGAADDLTEILKHVSVLAQDSLKGNHRATVPSRAQLTLQE